MIETNLMEYQFTKEHTQIAKGVAISLMLIHHLFRFPEMLNGVNYIGIIPGLDPTIEYILGDFAKICVSMYLFLSGYGLYKSAVKKERFTFRDSYKRILSFLTNYWVVFSIFVLIGLIWFNGNQMFSFNLNTVLANFFTISSTYNGVWWFVRLYIELLLLFPIVKLLLDKNIKLFALITTSLFSLSFFISLFARGNSIFQYLKGSELNTFLTCLFPFAIGCIFAKCNIFEKVCLYLNKIKLYKKYFYLFIMIMTIIFRCSINIIFTKYGKGAGGWFDFILAPIFIFASTSLLYSLKHKKVFSVIGEYSTNIWLTHTFFCWYYFQKLIFLPKFSVLILGWLMIICLTCSILINFVVIKVQKLTSNPNIKSFYTKNGKMQQ